MDPQHLDPETAVNLGKCDLFYRKYNAEMERQYEVDEPKVEGLPDPDRVL